MIALTAFLACLSFVIFFLHNVISLMRDILNSENVWKALNKISSSSLKNSNKDG